jgi:hypothetical protein
MDALYSDSLNRIGRAHMESKIATASWVTAPGQWEPGALRWCFYDCNVLGDPALAVFTDNPIPINTTFPATVLIGSSAMNVSVASAGLPAPGLTCVAMKDGVVIGKSVTNASGQAVIDFQVMVQDPGDAQLIVSGYNCTPVSYNFAFLPVSGPFVVYANSLINDAAGNQDNQADYGETILLTNGMRNVGGITASNVMVTLTTADPYVTITDSTELYSVIAAGDTLTISNAFTFIISDSVPNGHQVHFVLKAVSGTTWLSEFSIACHAPLLTAGSLVIDDAAGGNGNGKLDPGETVTFSIPSSNNGNSACSNTTGTLTTDSPWLSITSPVSLLGTLTTGASTNAQFTAQVSADAPVASIIELHYLLSSGNYHATALYFPTVKVIVEDFESGNFDKFPWTKLGLNYWTITSESPFEGLLCGRSAPIGDNRQSNMAITLNVLASDSISFYSKVSSEPIFDKMQFYIDIQPMDEWSGSVPWQRHSYAVTAGVHTFKWVYSKDMANAAGSDCAFVDFIVFPAYVDYTENGKLNKNQADLNISPNPATNKIYVEGVLKSSSIMTLQVFDSEGKIIIPVNEIAADNTGRFHRDLDISTLKPGYYTCVINSGATQITRSFIVL